MDNMSFYLLRIYSTHPALSLSQLAPMLNTSPSSLSEAVNHLRVIGYLRIRDASQNRDSIGLRTSLEITFEGRAALELEQKHRKESKDNKLRSWTAIVISIFALLVSVVSLIRQFMG